MASQLERQRERFESDPGDRSAFEALEEHYFLRGAWAELVALYERRLAAAAAVAENASESANVRFRLGQILEERCDDPERAIECYREAIRLDPGLRPPLRQLRRLHAQRGQWEVALQIAELEGAARMRPYERAEFLAEMGALWHARLEDPEQAVHQFEQALEASTDHVPAYVGLARALTSLGRNEEADAAWEQALARLRGPDRAPALVERGRLSEGPLHQSERALELYREALREDPRHREAVEALNVAAAAAGRRDEVAALAEQRFDLAAGALRRATIALEAGELHLDLQDLPSARLWFSRALELCPDDPNVHLWLARVEQRAGHPEDQARHLERALELAGEAATADLWLEAAELAQRRGDSEGARHRLRRAFGRAPEDPAVLDALSRSLTDGGCFDELADVLERRAALASAPADRAVCLAELGALAEEHLDDLDAARDAYARAFEADPTRPGLVVALERLLAKGEDWEALRDVLEHAQREGSPDERVGVLCSLGELRIARLGDAEGAARAFEEALTLDAAAGRALAGLAHVAAATGDEEAVLVAWEREAAVTSERGRLSVLVQQIVGLRERRGDAEAALSWVERWLEAAPDARDALEARARLLESLGRRDALCQTLERLDVLLHGTEQAANRRRLGGLHAAAGREEQALAAWRAALEVEPDDVASLRALLEGLLRCRDFAEAAAVQKRLAELLPPEERPACLESLARLLADELRDTPGAISILARLVQAGDASPDAAASLEQLLEQEGRYEELAERLTERRRSLDPNTAEARSLDLRRAYLLLDRLERPSDAAALLRSLHAMDAADTEVTDALERALRAARDVEGLLVLLEARAADVSDAARRATLELERARLLEEEASRPADARPLYAKLVDASEAPQVAAEASQRLERLLEREGDHAALAAHLERRLAQARGGDAAVLHARLAQLAGHRLHDRGRALRHLEAAVALEPRRPEHWRALARLYHEDDRPADTLRAFEGEIAAGCDAERALTVHLHAARIAARALDDADRAALHYRAVLEADPLHSEATEFETAHLERAERFAELVELLEARLHALEAREGTPHPAALEERTQVRVRLAALYADALDDLDAAIARLEGARREAGALAPVADALADLYQRAGQHAELAALCEQEADRARADDRARWLVRLGDARRAEGDDARAAEAYRRARLERPGDRALAAALRPLYRRLRETALLARLLEDELRLGTPEEIAVRLELAELFEGDLHRPEEALDHRARVLAIDPHDGTVLDRALALAERLERPEVALDLVDRVLASEPARARRADLLARRAALLAGPLARPEAAIEAYEEALTQAPDRPSLRRSLRETLERLGRYEEALERLRAEADAAAPAERAALLEHGARVAEGRLGSDAALAWLERLRALRSDDPALALQIADLHRRAGRPGAWLRGVEAALPLLEDAQRGVALHKERARVLETELAVPVRAAAAWAEVHRLAPRDAEPLRALDRLYTNLGRLHELVEVLEERIPLESGSERRRLRVRLAELRAGPLGDPEGAAAPLLGALADPALDPDDRLVLLERLEAALRAADRPEGWVQAAESELATLTPAEPAQSARRRELHRELATTYESELGRPDSALGHLRALVDSGSPDCAVGSEFQAAEDELLRRLEETGRHVERAGRLAARLTRLADDLPSWLAFATLQEEQLGSPAAAVRAYREAARLAPQDGNVLRGLRRCAERLGDWEQVASALERELTATAHAPSEEASYARRLGRVAWDEIHDAERARRAFARALELDPTDLVSLRGLEQIAESQSAWPEAIAFYEREIENLEPDATERLRTLWLRVAELSAGRLDDLDRADRAYAEADRLEPLEAPALRLWAGVLHQRGRLERHADVLAAWCDHPASGATALDHVELARTRISLDQPERALARLERALEADPTCGPAWTEIATLRETTGDLDAASAAWERVAELTAGAESSRARLRSARTCESRDPARALALLEQATETDPTNIAAHADLARLAEHREQTSLCLDAATRALELDAANPTLDVPQRAEVALAGARAARALERDDACLALSDRALAAGASSPDAFLLRGEARLRLGDAASARTDLEVSLRDAALTPKERARRLVLLATALEAGDPDAALARFEEAVATDHDAEAAHAGLARGLERAGRATEAMAALSAWAALPSVACPERAAHLLHASELAEAAKFPDTDRLLEAATAADPRCTAAWQRVAERRLEAGRAEDAAKAAARGLEHAEGPEARAALGRAHARALEAADKSLEAAHAWGGVVRADPRDVDAALAGSRLLRVEGRWAEAAALLREAAERHPGDDRAAVATLLRELARLLAGPLEDLDGAVEAYRKALAADPERRDVREALAELLGHCPERSSEAAALHRELLDADPTRASSLRALVRIAQSHGCSQAAAEGLAILAALGVASPDESSAAPRRLGVRVATPARLPSEADERLRAAVRSAAAWLDEAPEANAAPPAPNGSDDAIVRFLAARRAAEADLAAPALVGLSAERFADVIQGVVRLARDETDAAASASAARLPTPGWRVRRRIRRALSAEEVETLEQADLGAWRDELRALAAGVVLDAGDGELRTALQAALGENEVDPATPVGSKPVPPLAAEADLTPWIAESPAARCLLRRVVRAWVATF